MRWKKCRGNHVNFERFTLSGLAQSIPIVQQGVGSGKWKTDKTWYGNVCTNLPGNEHKRSRPQSVCHQVWAKLSKTRIGVESCQCLIESGDVLFSRSLAGIMTKMNTLTTTQSSYGETSKVNK